MNLYSLNFEHYSQKDCEEGNKVLLLAENDEQVCDWFLTGDKPDKVKFWPHREEYIGVVFDQERQEFIHPDGEVCDEEFYDDDENPESHRARVIRLRGEINDDLNSYDDLYYGKTYYGWTLEIENTTTDYTEMIAHGLVIDLTNP